MKFSNRIFRFQEGGAMPATAGQPVDQGYAEEGQGMPETGQEMPEEGQEPNGQDEILNQAAQVAQQLIQEAGPELSAIIFQIGMQMLGQLSQGSNELPAAEEQPTFLRRGGRLVRIK